MNVLVVPIPRRDPDGTAYAVEVAETYIALTVNGDARVGVLLDDPEGCDDPTLVVWASEEHGGGEALLSLHLGKIDFTQPNTDIARAIADDLEITRC